MKKRSLTVVMAALPPCGKQNLAMCSHPKQLDVKKKEKKIPA